jgi:hypothetical protein
MHVYRRDDPFRYGRFGTTRFTLFAWPFLLLAAGLIGFAVAVLVQVVPAAGQIAAVGFSEAWTRYRDDWFAFAYAGAIAMATLLVGAGCIDRFYVWWHGRRGFRYSGLILTTVIVALAVAWLWGAARYAYLDARDNPSQQTEVLPPVVRSSIVAALADADVDRNAILKSREEALSISRELAQNQQRVARLRKLLAGAEPISKLDLEVSQRNGRIEGIVLGILTSIVASYNFAWLPRPRGAQDDV